MDPPLRRDPVIGRNGRRRADARLRPEPADARAGPASPRAPLRWAPGVTLVVLLAPVAAGLAGTIAPAVGWLPALGGGRVGLAAFEAVWRWPGLPRAVALSLTTGLGATVCALALVVAICAGWHGTRVFRAIERTLAPLLAVPHAAAAFGVAFLIAPSGWIARVLSPGVTGWDRPPDLLIVQDPFGLSLLAGLVAKEVPFLLLMTLATLAPARAEVSRTMAQALGYGRVTAWVKTVLPRIYPQLRLPVYAVLAYAMSTVDVAIILGPSTPPTLAVQIVRWMHDPDLGLRFQAAAAALVQLGLVAGALGLWRAGETVVGRLGRRWIERGGRGYAEPVARGIGLGAVIVAATAIAAGLAGLVVWSVAGLWSFPDAMPEALTARSWQRYGARLLAPVAETLLIAVAATGLALGFALASLEAERRHGPHTAARALWLLYLPLVIPQVAFLLGLQMVALATGLEAGRSAVIAGHLVFVLPYVLLSLAGPFRAWDDRYATIAAALGAGPGRIFWTVRLPMLLRPVLAATAVGMAVSVGQYLSTLALGAGRIQTITTEAIALAAGGDRRTIGVFAVAQTAAALLPFLIAVGLPRLIWRRRRGLRDA